jgi:hypothetical protein
MDALKHSVEPVVTWGVLELMGVSPKLVERLILAYFARRVSFVMTNVPGPERPLYLAGHPVEGVMFWVPQSGRVGLGISIFSYAGTLRIGVASDAHLVPDPERLVEAFHRELEELGLAGPAASSDSGRGRGGSDPVSGEAGGELGEVGRVGLGEAQG